MVIFLHHLHVNTQQLRSNGGVDLWYDNYLRLDNNESFSVNVSRFAVYHVFGVRYKAAMTGFVLRLKCYPTRADIDVL